MSIIEASSGTYRSRVDGTIVLSVEISPIHRAAALALFGMPGTPMALAALKAGYAMASDDQPAAPAPPPDDKPKGGERAKLCGIWCNTPDFRDWMRRHYPAAWRVNATHPAERENAASVLRAVLAIESRAEIDNDPAIAGQFDAIVRRPYMAHLESKGIPA
ncbi:MAG: hypothetical protein V4792_09930 [Pseudomonadota bacterium]